MATKHPRLAVVMDPDLKERMTELAARHRRTLSAEIETACEAWVEQHQPVAPPSNAPAGHTERLPA